MNATISGQVRERLWIAASPRWIGRAQRNSSWTNHPGMNPVKRVVKQIQDEPLVENVENDLNLRVNKTLFTVPTDESIQGDWKLNVADHADADQRKLNRWALKLAHV